MRWLGMLLKYSKGIDPVRIEENKAIGVPAGTVRGRPTAARLSASRGVRDATQIDVISPMSRRSRFRRRPRRRL